LRIGLLRSVDPAGVEDDVGRNVVLVVARDAEVRDVVQMLLQQVMGVPTAAAGNAKEALEKAQELKPAVVLVDILLPELDGLQVVRALKSNQATAAIPLIATTAIDGECWEAKKAGCADCIQVPFNIDSLARIVQKYLPGERERTTAA